MKMTSNLVFVFTLIVFLSPALCAADDRKPFRPAARGELGEGFVGSNFNDDTDPHQSMAVYSDKQLQNLKVEEVFPKKEFKDKYSRTVVTEDNLNFRVAPDRPIEKYNAYQGPISLDSYVYMKFKEQEQIINSRFDAINFRLNSLEKSISDLKTLMAPNGSLAVEEKIAAEEPENRGKLV